LTFLTAVSISNADELNALKGKTIRGVIGEGAGETTDVQSRLFFKYLQIALPGTTILLQNKPGGGGSKALKELFDASGDILTIATLSRHPIYAYLMKPDDIPYDITKVIWVGSLAKVNRIFAVRSNMGGATVNYLENLDRQPMVGATSSLGAAAIEPLMLNAMTKLRFKVVSGMSEAERKTMLLAGNLDGRMGTLYELQPLFDSGEMVPVLKFTKEGYPKSLDNVPTIGDVVEVDGSKDIVSVLETLDRIGAVMVAAAPNSDPEMLKGLRLAFDKVTSNPDFRTEAAKIYFDISPTQGSELTEELGRIIGPTKDMGEKMRAAFDCGTKKSDTGALTCN
jgi:tripartite-type tricarboxylate transporter receptor subunit TctC